MFLFVEGEMEARKGRNKTADVQGKMLNKLKKKKGSQERKVKEG